MFGLKRRTSPWLGVAAAVAVAMPAAAQTTIGASGGDTIQSWGKDNTQTYGQTITTPTDNILNSFSFWLGPTSTNYTSPTNPSLNFQAYVYQWDASLGHAVGPSLYTSGVMTYNATPSSPFAEYAFNTGGLSLTSGDMYTLFLSTSGLTGTGRIQWEAATGDEYAGGNFVFLNNGEDQSQWTSSEWASGMVSDLHFSASFGNANNVVPEPRTWILLASGLVGLLFGPLRSRLG